MKWITRILSFVTPKKSTLEEATRKFVSRARDPNVSDETLEKYLLELLADVYRPEAQKQLNEALDAASWQCVCVCREHGRQGCRQCCETKRCPLHGSIELDRLGRLDSVRVAQKLWAIAKINHKYFDKKAVPRVFTVAVGEAIAWARNHPKKVS